MISLACISFWSMMGKVDLAKEAYDLRGELRITKKFVEMQRIQYYEQRL